MKPTRRATKRSTNAVRRAQQRREIARREHLERIQAYRDRLMAKQAAK